MHVAVSSIEHLSFLLSDLYFSFNDQLCNWIENVCEPCGTLLIGDEPRCAHMEDVCELGIIPEE